MILIFMLIADLTYHYIMRFYMWKFIKKKSTYEKIY